ncbi:hypothetical protein PROFUN_16237 [Planoprotostelium fungivorum]|uniref:Uncharacterized protein n=1 Tax=Planoprotostelium fungivorum TaxID=1890364 RepID=A0A2P6MML6_9EUKA|nr:hypothetical protein PROFUN_16237 [Planoprotostelium fungivorum]
MADPLNTLRLAIQAKILQENDEPALSLKIFDPQCASRLAAWNVQANPAADIRGYKPPAQTALTGPLWGSPGLSSSISHKGGLEGPPEYNQGTFQHCEEQLEELIGVSEAEAHTGISLWTFRNW